MSVAGGTGAVPRTTGGGEDQGRVQPLLEAGTNK